MADVEPLMPEIAVEEKNASDQSADAEEVITGTLTGRNILKGENLFQLIFIALSVVLCSCVAFIASAISAVNTPAGYGLVNGEPHKVALLGGVGGLILGLVLSSLILSVYRLKKKIDQKKEKNKQG